MREKKEIEITANRGLRRSLLDWYRVHQRDLPWRSATPDPYRILVSEVMLQQTQVEVVRPRFVEFLAAFPTVKSLASASGGSVRAQWSGLGYYRRAERLHQAAKEIVAQGCFPCSAAELQKLPGIGEYTSAAIASIAFGECVPVLDGNVERVLSRLLALNGNPKHRSVRRTLLAEAAQLVDREHPGDSNQALMELGATICTKRSPGCSVCPLSSRCSAGQQGRQLEFPSAQPKRPRKQKRWFQLVCLRTSDQVHAPQGEVLLMQRRENEAVLAGAWLLPEAPGSGGASSGKPQTEIGRFRHSITTTDYEVVLLRASAYGGEVQEPERVGPSRWVPLDDFDQEGRWQGVEPLPTSSMLAKAIRLLRTQRKAS